VDLPHCHFTRTDSHIALTVDYPHTPRTRTVAGVCGLPHLDGAWFPHHHHTRFHVRCRARVFLPQVQFRLVTVACLLHRHYLRALLCAVPLPDYCPYPPPLRFYVSPSQILPGDALVWCRTRCARYGSFTVHTRLFTIPHGYSPHVVVRCLPLRVWLRTPSLPARFHHSFVPAPRLFFPGCWITHLHVHTTHTFTIYHHARLLHCTLDFRTLSFATHTPHIPRSSLPYHTLHTHTFSSTVVPYGWLHFWFGYSSVCSFTHSARSYFPYAFVLAVLRLLIHC